MKKLFLILVLSILSFVAVLAVSNKVFASEKTATEQIEELLEEYFGEGQYTKLTTLAYDEKEGNYHAGANQRQRRTYYDEKVNALLMGDYDGKFEHINSGYALDGADMVHYRNNAEEKTLENLFTAREENYAVLNENPVDFYDVLSDIKNKVHNMQLAKSEQFVFENGMFTYVNEKGATIQNGSYDDGFLKQMQYFAAPMLLLNNGIKLSKVNIFEAETINDKKVLVMQLYTTEGNLVSTALVLKGLTMNAVELKFKMLSNKTTWSYPMGQEAENYEDGQYRLYRVSLEKGQALKLTNVSKWLGYDELENKDDFGVDNDKNILVKESGKYDIYIKNNGSQVYIGKSKALYEIKQGNEVLAQEEDRQIEGKDHAVFEQNLEKGSIVKVAKEGELLHFYVNDEDKGTAYQTEAPGLHIFYVNNEDKVYVTAPSYVLLMDGAVQANAGIDKGNDNAKFRIELAKDAEIQIKKDEAKLHFYNNEQEDLGDKLIISKAGIYVFYVNSEDKIYFEEEIQEGPHKLLSSVLGWDYEVSKVLLAKDDNNQMILIRYDFAKDEAFKISNRKNMWGYSALEADCKGLVDTDEFDNIVIKEAGKYNIYLKENGNMWFAKAQPIYSIYKGLEEQKEAKLELPLGSTDKAQFELQLAKGEKAQIYKDDDKLGSEYVAPRNGLYKFYVNKDEEIYITEPDPVYTIKVNGELQEDKEMEKGDNKAAFELVLAKGNIVIIEKDDVQYGEQYVAPRAGTYQIYINNEGNFWANAPLPSYELKVNGNAPLENPHVETTGSNHAEFELQLAKGNKVVILLDEVALSLSYAEEEHITEYVAPRNGLYHFYVNEKDVIYVTEPAAQYAVLLNDEAQQNKEIENDDPKNVVVYQLDNVAKGSKIEVIKDDDKLYFYHWDNEKEENVKDDNKYNVGVLSNVIIYVNYNGELYVDYEIITGDWKFVSSKETINWDYEQGTLLTDGEDNQKVLLEFELAAGEEFKLSNRKDWYGYSHLEDDCKGLFEEGDNIKVKDAGKYDIYLKESGYIWIAKSKVLYELKVDGNVEKSMKEVAGDYHAEFSVELTKGQKVKIEKEKVLLGEEYTAPRNGIYTFKVTNKDIIEVVAPNALYELKVNGNTPEGDIISGEALGNNHVIYELQLAKGDKVIIKKDGESLNEEYQAPRKGTYKFYVNGSDEVYPVAPKVLYELKVGGEVKDSKEQAESGNLAEFKITLAKGNTFTVERDEVELGEVYQAPRAGEYSIYVYVEDEEVKVSVVEPLPVYDLKVNGNTPEGNYKLNPAGNNLAEFKVTLAKDDTYVIEKDELEFGEAHQAPRAGEYSIYVYVEDEEVKVSIVEPEALYVILVDGVAQTNASVTPNQGDKLAFELKELERGKKIKITKDGEELHFYANENNKEVDKGTEHAVAELSDIRFDINSKDEIWLEISIIAGDWKFVSSKEAINWDYEQGTLLTDGEDNQKVLLEFELAAGEEFKLSNRKDWYGYDKLKEGCQALFDNENGNIKVKEAGNYDIYLKADGSMWIEKVKENITVSFSITREVNAGHAMYVAGTFNEWTLDLLVEDENHNWTKSYVILEETQIEFKFIDKKDSDELWYPNDNIVETISKTNKSFAYEWENTNKVVNVSLSVTRKADDGNAMYVAGSFTNWEKNPLKMTKGANDVWSITVEVPATTITFKFVEALDSNFNSGTVWMPDPNLSLDASKSNSYSCEWEKVIPTTKVYSGTVSGSWDFIQGIESIYAYYWGSSDSNCLVKCYDINKDSNTLKVELPNDISGFLLVRVDPNNEPTSLTSWPSSIWNQTYDAEINGTTFTATAK